MPVIEVRNAGAAPDSKPKKLAGRVYEHSQGMDTMVAFDTHFDDTGVAEGDEVGDSVNGLLNMNNVWHGGIAMAARFPEIGTVEYGTELDMNEEIILVGTLMGAAGKFHCTEVGDNTCSISKTAAGYSFSGTNDAATNWHFTADAGAMVVLPDDDYTGYGWWATDTAVDAFVTESANASRLTLTPNGPAFEALEGKATYEGPAVGQFAIDNRPLGTNLEAGHFTAVATLVADFEENVAGGEGSSISGTVDEFVANDVARDDWKVTLGAANVALTDPTVDGEPGDPHFSLGDPGVVDDELLVDGAPFIAYTANLWTIDGVPGVKSGTWSGNFYNDGKPRNDGTPEVVTGTFSVSHGSRGEVAHMIGAFQANNTHADTPSTDN